MEMLPEKETQPLAELDQGNDQFERVMDQPVGRLHRDTRIEGVIIGKLVSLDGPLVTFPGQSQAVKAATLQQFQKRHLNRDVALMFENGDIARPIIMGCLWQAEKPEAKNLLEQNEAEGVEVSLDGQRISLCAKQEIVLKCGKASITLTKAGKILIRGAYLLSRSSGVNRIKGGSVQLN